jgi:hypothetical protein
MWVGSTKRAESAFCLTNLRQLDSVFLHLIGGQHP